ncbi:hypothetical protein KIM372_17080 [Bombiscardovia nodaiensis]|uniref:Damage-inducible protein J n=1 Tax=Bombiscardovia nodaiensis TaxID=2932181 RepID=A0ABM8BA66_9BIFI|nr:hypothetical protein KIM372_17080 [Bombiscardovia nodaiensis]
MVQVTIRVSAADKVRASHIVEELGLDLSSVTRAFYKQIIRERRIPLDLSYDDPEPTAETLQALREADEMIANGTGIKYDTPEEAMQAIFDEDDREQAAKQQERQNHAESGTSSDIHSRR